MVDRQGDPQFPDTEPINDRLRMLLSITSRMKGFFYRCRNDANYTMDFVSDSIRGLLGYPPEDFILNRTRNFVSVIHPEDVPLTDNTTQSALQKRTTWDFDYRMVCSDGKDIWVNEVGGGVYDENNDLLYLEGFIVDITDRKLLEVRMARGIERLSNISSAIGADAGRILQVLSALRMLALNARIEAGRVGELGAGFSVVAEEIKSLASVTQSSASRIGTLMSELVTILNEMNDSKAT